ncbi:TPA: hypothetical protein N0F65_009356 [Lagenidium giganteum]|uniref:Histone-lysine N-methyltransferase ASHH3 n=1 Tax=Lagenidium giganteum TaxID=4803 RepID=A0AAV2ZFP8_9STRA|nr:TPA: hypothetical protein N0F65_009356 [Lagenidium giganteum]
MFCGENCHNRMLFISCTEDSCSAPDPNLCSNRSIQRRENKAVRVEYIPGPGFGLIADQHIAAGDFVIEYIGEVIDDKECERRLIHCRDLGETHFYMLELEKDIVIDARHRSNEARFINHSCDPNCMTQKWNVDGLIRIGIFARRNVLPNEEITIDYNFSHFGEAVVCKCGSSSCVGRIGLKRSEVPIVIGPQKATKVQEAEDAPPLEITRPVALSSLALLKTAQVLIADIIAFTNGNSKWNKRIPSSRNVDPDRIYRFIENAKNGQQYLSRDLNDLNEDCCHRCGQAGQLVCCDGCPAAFHLS